MGITKMFGVSNSFGQPSGRPFEPLPAFGAGNNADNNPFAAEAFGDASAFASQSPEFVFGGGSTPKFGTKPRQSTTGTSSIPSFGFTGNPAFGGSSSAPAFGTSSFPRFRSPSAPPPAFGLTTNATSSCGAGTLSGSTSSNPSFGSWAASTAPAFGKTTASSSFRQSTPFPSISQNDCAGTQLRFGVPGIGTRVTSYKVTDVHEVKPRKMHSISAMPVHVNKSHEELRWEDHQLENKEFLLCAATADFNPFHLDKAGRNPFWLSSTSSCSKTTSNPFTSVSAGSTSTATTVLPTPFATTQQNPLSAATSPITFPSIAPPGPSSLAVPSFFPANTTSNFLASMTATKSSTSSATASISPFTLPLSKPFLANTFPVPHAPFSFSSQTRSSLVQPATPSSFTAIPALQQTTFPSFQSSATAQTNRQTWISSLPHLANPVGLNQASLPIAPVQSSQPPQTTSSFNVSNPGQMPTTTGTGGLHNVQTAQPAPVTNPFGTLPLTPQLSFNRSGASHPIQYGISTLPVVEKPARARSSSLLINTSRDLSYRQLKLSVRKYNPRNNVPKAPFFSDNDEGIAATRADAFFIRRENPRDLIIRPPPGIWMSHSDNEESPPLKEACYVAGESEDEPLEEKHNRSCSNPVFKNGDPSATFTQLNIDKVLQKVDREAEIEALMPKLHGSDYYTEPVIQELAAKEKANPGFCSHVKGFVIGRHNYGNIRFLGDTDVRGLDLNILVQFNHREVIVYPDESTKPPVGEGLNKPAEVTLLNIKCQDKKARQQYTEGPQAKKYTEYLEKKAEEQGAHFVSYDPVKGEWKFGVDHF